MNLLHTFLQISEYQVSLINDADTYKKVIINIENFSKYMPNNKTFKELVNATNALILIIVF